MWFEAGPSNAAGARPENLKIYLLHSPLGGAITKKDIFSRYMFGEEHCIFLGSLIAAGQKMTELCRFEVGQNLAQLWRPLVAGRS